MQTLDQNVICRMKINTGLISCPNVCENLGPKYQSDDDGSNFVPSIWQIYYFELLQKTNELFTVGIEFKSRW